MSPVAGLSDTLCLTFFSLGVFEVFQLFFCTVTFSKTSGMCLDGNIWQSNGKRFLNYDLSDIVMSDVCQTGQKWAKTAYGANHTLGRLPRAARVPPRRSKRAQGMPDRLPRPWRPVRAYVSDLSSLTSSSIQIQGKMRTIFTIFYLKKNRDCNFLRFSQNLWRRYVSGC